MLDLQEDIIYHKKYDVEKQLGKGSFGVVYRIKDKENGLIYAAKHMKVRKREQKQQIVEEIKILQSLNHPEIISFEAAYEKKGVRGEIILVTEYLNGGELFERIVSEEFNLTESVCAEFMKQILQAVDYLHKNNIVHLDLKPENIVCVSPDSLEIKIIDFGLARKLEPGEEVRTMCGTPGFVAPEIVNYDCISTATDMWSLGVLCYVLISGLAPFEGDDEAETYVNISYGDYGFESEEFEDISENAKDFIDGLLRKDQRKRMTAEQCQEHEWMIQRKNRSDVVINTENLKKFLNKRRWKGVINVKFALKTMKSTENLIGDEIMRKEMISRQSGRFALESMKSVENLIRDDMKNKDSGIESNEASGDEDFNDSKNASEILEEKNEVVKENLVENKIEEFVQTSVPQPTRISSKTYFQVDLKIVSGKNLVKMDLGSKSDPYVKIVFKNKTVKKTKVKKNTLEPTWNEKFKFFIEKEEYKKSYLLFKVFDKDLIGKDFMGVSAIDLDFYDLQKPYEVDLILEDGGNGKLKKFESLGSIRVVLTLLLIDLYYQPC